VSRQQPDQEAKLLTMMNLLARTIADRLDLATPATPARRARPDSTTPTNSEPARRQ
jgi:hypothetical protein